MSRDRRIVYDVTANSSEACFHEIRELQFGDKSCHITLAVSDFPQRIFPATESVIEMCQKNVSPDSNLVVKVPGGLTFRVFQRRLRL